MLYYVSENQVVGANADPNSIPNGWTVAEGADDLSPEQCYFDGEMVRQKPDRPSPEHFWSEQEKAWVAPVIPEPTIVLNWTGLVAGLRGSMVWGKVFEASTRTLKAQSAFTLLYGTLTAVHNLDDLRLAIALIREAMRGIGAIGDFTADELAWIGDRLEECNFNRAEFDLEPAP